MKRLFLIFCTMFLFSLGVYGMGGPSPIAIAKTTGVIIDFTGNAQYLSNGNQGFQQFFYPVISLSTENSYYLTSYHTPDIKGLEYIVVTEGTVKVEEPAVLIKTTPQTSFDQDTRETIKWNIYEIFVPCASKYNQGEPVCHQAFWSFKNLTNIP